MSYNPFENDTTWDSDDSVPKVGNRKLDPDYKHGRKVDYAGAVLDSMFAGFAQHITIARIVTGVGVGTLIVVVAIAAGA